MRWMKGWGGRHWVATLGVLAFVALAGMGIARAQGGPGPGGSCARGEGFLTPEDRQIFGDRVMQRLSEKIGLTPEVAQEIRGLFQSQRDRMRDDMQKLCEARQEFQQAMARQDATPEAVKAAAERLKSLQGALLDRRVENSLTLRSKLTAEQWAKWQEMRKGLGQHFRRHRSVS
ncbi:MAG: periplasmic heavy metal sensor [candidate division NC10 bacterium]|nr:periplasmic heavy metal sensor [candidate division NC10 bacterium]